MTINIGSFTLFTHPEDGNTESFSVLCSLHKVAKRLNYTE